MIMSSSMPCSTGQEAPYCLSESPGKWAEVSFITRKPISPEALLKVSVCPFLRQCNWVDGISPQEAVSTPGRYKRMILLGYRKMKQASTVSFCCDIQWHNLLFTQICIFPLQSPTYSVLCSIIWIVNTKCFLITFIFKCLLQNKIVD